MRLASNQDGLNFQGDKTGAKWATLVAKLPKVEKTGNLDLRPGCHVAQITHDAKGKVDGVLYFECEVLHRQAARVVCVAANAIESARLLLLSGSPRFPDGMANSSGEVGENYMRHLTASSYARFEQPVHMYRGETMAGIVADETGLDVGRGFVGGYNMETLSLGPAFLAAFADPGAWGPTFSETIEGYENTAGLWIVGEDMPQSTNRVRLNGDAKDQHGLPVSNVHFDDRPNDVAMRSYAWQHAAELYRAVGALAVTDTPPYPSTHNMGTCRMSADPTQGVVDRFGRAHDVPDLFLSDGSVFTTGAAANPTLTIVALAVRQAEHIVGQLKAGAL